MKVKHLIELLKQQNQDADVWLSFDEFHEGEVNEVECDKDGKLVELSTFNY